jgi:hypothetical protein
MNDFVTPILIVAALAAVVTGAIWLLHVVSVQSGRKELKAFKEQVVELSDKLDALKERHKLLPHLSRGFTVPMSGETLSAYDDVAARLEQHRQEWLRLMDVWEQAQALLESETMFGSRRARSARRNLRAADAPAATASLVRDCEASLDRIEHAHQQAATELTSFQKEDQLLNEQLDSVAASELSIAPYQSDRSAAAEMVGISKSLLTADPLATLRHLAEARDRIAEVRRRVGSILEHSATTKVLSKKITDVRLSATQRRSQGFLLREEGSNPDPLLADVEQLLAMTIGALNQGDEATASSLLAKSAMLTEQARQGLENHVAAKGRYDAEIAARQRESLRLSEALATARSQHAELSRDFAPDTWLGVADNTQRAPTALAAAEQYMAEASRCASADVQHYQRAAKLLDQAAANHKQSDTEVKAVGLRLKELIDVRSACQSHLGRLRTQSDRVSHLLVSNTTDRASANERFRGARLALDRLFEDSRSQRPDWTRLTTRVKEIEADLARAEQLAKEDLQLSQQAAAEIAETEKVIREAKAFCEHGITTDVTAAESELAQARGSMLSQGYEEAIRLANAAEQMARAAHQESRARALRRQQELESIRAAEQAAIARPIMQAEAGPQS